mmetsp:Transcript_89063/g.232172  ORF Transcript_89063/g.232172 Transcript_89063/m.232172 type:complete len:237 (+) Transcript_89063:101-811(+)
MCSGRILVPAEILQRPRSDRALLRLAGAPPRHAQPAPGLLVPVHGQAPGLRARAAARPRDAGLQGPRNVVGVRHEAADHRVLPGLALAGLYVSVFEDALQHGAGEDVELPLHEVPALVPAVVDAMPLHPRRRIRGGHDVLRLDARRRVRQVLQVPQNLGDVREVVHVVLGVVRDPREVLPGILERLERLLLHLSVEARLRQMLGRDPHLPFLVAFPIRWRPFHGNWREVPPIKGIQ